MIHNYMKLICAMYVLLFSVLPFIGFVNVINNLRECLYFFILEFQLFTKISNCTHGTTTFKKLLTVPKYYFDQFNNNVTTVIAFLYI